MTKIRKIIQSKKAMSYPLVIAIVLSIIIISFASYEYIRLMLIAQGVREGVQSSIISVSTGNYSDVYASIREGYSGGYVNDGGGFNEQINPGDVYGRLSSVLGLTRVGSRYVKYVDGGIVEYRVWGLNINIINAPFAPSNHDTAQRFRAEATIELEIPLSFGWGHLPPMRITLKVSSGWTPRF